MPRLTIIVAVLAALATALTGGLLTEIGPWYRGLRKPSWQPPDWAFGPAWTLIFACAAWSGVVAWEATGDDGLHLRIAALFAANAVLNVVWSLLFFRLRRPDWAMIEVRLLLLSIVALIVGLAPIAPQAAWLIVPYLLWVTFAAVLNREVVRLNAPFRATARA
jgi:tryptophan-rich sensory protein